VVNGKLVAAAKRVPAHVVGDGTRDRAGRRVNKDPRRGIGRESADASLDEQSDRLLAQQQLTRAAVRGRSRVCSHHRTSAPAAPQWT
jgi:cyanophycin synthetase